MRMCHFQAQNVAFVLNKLFLVQTIIITLIYQLALFIVQNFKKILQWIQSYEDAPFLGTKWFIYSNFFFGKNYYHFHLPIGPFHCAKFKNQFLQRMQSCEDAPFLGPKWPICPNENFSEKLLISLAPFIHACPHPKNQSEINLLMKYLLIY